MNTARLTVTLPREVFQRVEKEKKKRCVSRSAFVDTALEEFFRREDETEKEARYIAGYKKKPENLKEITALVGIQAAVVEDY